jgi:hypothetical protein
VGGSPDTCEAGVPEATQWQGIGAAQSQDERAAVSVPTPHSRSSGTRFTKARTRRGTHPWCGGESRAGLQRAH